MLFLYNKDCNIVFLYNKVGNIVFYVKRFVLLFFTKKFVILCFFTKSLNYCCRCWWTLPRAWYLPDGQPAQPQLCLQHQEHHHRHQVQSQCHSKVVNNCRVQSQQGSELGYSHNKVVQKSAVKAMLFTWVHSQQGSSLRCSHGKVVHSGSVTTR